MTDKTHRSAVTGKFVTAEQAKTNPDTTVSESRDDLAAELRRLRGVNHNLQVALYGANVKIVELEAAPIVRTVGDLTARHQLTRPTIGVNGRVGELKVVKPFEYPGRLTLIWGDWWEDVAPDTPCEVLE